MPQSRGTVEIGAAVPSLVRWGCSADADLVYRTLLTHGNDKRCLGELDLGRRRLDDAIAELVSIDAVAPDPRGGAEPGWLIRPPREVVAALHRRRLARRQRAAPVLPPPLPQPLAFGEGMRYLPTRALARDRMNELVQAVRREHMSMHPELRFQAESMQAAQPLDRAVLERGARMRVLGVQPSDEEPIVSASRPVMERRLEYRQAPSVPMKLIILDQRVAVFPVDPGDLDRGYLEVAQPPIVSALVALFEQNWERGWDAWEDTMPRVTLSDREHALVALLVHGHTDVTAAQELGISARSVSTIVRNLMDRFEVDNRFQLGVALGALRILPPPHRATPSQNEDRHETT